MAIIDEIFDLGVVRGIGTGYESIDSIIGGIKKGELTILAGATGMGKSLMGANILVNMAKNNNKVVYVDLENGAPLSKYRLLKIYHGLPEAWFADRRNKSKAEQLLKEIETNLKYVSFDTLNDFEWVGIEGMLSLMSTMSAVYKVFLIDPLQALETSMSGDRLLQEQGSIVKTLKEFAQKEGVSIILCHHIRKSTSSGGQWVSDMDDVGEVKYRVPNLDDLRGSGKISDYAQVVWGMVRTHSNPTPEGRGKTLLRILKNRSGKKGDVKLFFNEDTLIFSEEYGSDVNKLFDGDLTS